MRLVLDSSVAFKTLIPETESDKAINLFDDYRQGSHELKLDDLEFDSLAWMEFCISVELQSGLDLAPSDIEEMQFTYQIEDWLRARLETV